MKTHNPLAFKPLSASLAVVAGSMLLAADASAVGYDTQALLSVNDQFGVGLGSKHLGGLGASLSLRESDLNLPSDSTARGEVHVAPGSIRFQGQATTRPEDGLQQMTMWGSFLDVLTISVAPKSSGSVQLIARVDGTFVPDPAAVGPNIYSALVSGGIRAHVTSSTSPWVHASISNIGFDNAGAGGWDFTAFPFGEAPWSGYSYYQTSPENSLDTGLQILTFHYSNASEHFSADFVIAIQGSAVGSVRGTSSLDFMNTISLDVLLPKGTSYSTESGFTGYIQEVSVPESGGTILLLAFASTGMCLVARSRARRPQIG